MVSRVCSALALAGMLLLAVQPAHCTAGKRAAAGSGVPPPPPPPRSPRTFGLRGACPARAPRCIAAAWPAPQLPAACPRSRCSTVQLCVLSCRPFPTACMLLLTVPCDACRAPCHLACNSMSTSSCLPSAGGSPQLPLPLPAPLLQAPAGASCCRASLCPLQRRLRRCRWPVLRAPPPPPPSTSLAGSCSTSWQRRCVGMQAPTALVLYRCRRELMAGCRRRAAHKPGCLACCAGFLPLPTLPPCPCNYSPTCRPTPPRTAARSSPPSLWPRPWACCSTAWSPALPPPNRSRWV